MIIQQTLGQIQISDEVISKMVGKITAATREISSMSAGLVESVSKIWSGRSLQNGIAIRRVDNSVEINVKIIVYYGSKVHEVCRELQQKVIDQVEHLTGVSIQAVNVFVDGMTSEPNYAKA
ncbi:Asp23/Gls24 family envelope stress response protein [Paenibacillus xylanexedens]|uniref:Asp23/Gls24 family envelope stress response protein n=1 Tax=Paenibacillus xylanexedens TaxID=528191 RepID=UPI0011A12DFC|nr:Asp23/Gls24 family envelope stress response protein [Paenibacillus xylanexedens]